MRPKPAINKSKKQSDSQSIDIFATTIKTLIDAHNVVNANLLKMVNKYQDMEREVNVIDVTMQQLAEAAAEMHKTFSEEMLTLKSRIAVLETTAVLED